MQQCLCNIYAIIMQQAPTPIIGGKISELIGYLRDIFYIYKIGKKMQCTIEFPAQTGYCS